MTDLGTRDGIGPGHVLSVFQRGDTVIDPFARPPRLEVAGRRYLETDPKYQGGVRGALVAADDAVVNTSNAIGGFIGQFLPGRTDPRNASTNAIDGGACADVIATLLHEVPDLFSEDERARSSSSTPSVSWMARTNPGVREW